MPQPAVADYCATGVFTACHARNPNCTCLRTTRQATFCGDITEGAAVDCRECLPDSDCEEEFGPGAACLVYGGICTSFCADAGGTACAPSCDNTTG
jgi:hypothetical protein